MIRILRLGKRLLDGVRGPRRAELAALVRRMKNLETALDCLIENQPWVASDETGFNGQGGRKKLFQQLLETFPFEAIVETGTWLGDTTGDMAGVSNLPLYTCEIDRRFFGLAKARLKDFKNVSLSLSDSRSFLRHLASTDTSRKTVFFYLDAHFYDDLPLGEELDIIAKGWDNLVIMVDDFKVPGDAGYGYDEYGRGKELSLKTYQDILAKHDLVPLFPSITSRDETGKKRGCVVLARSGDWANRLGANPSLRRIS